MVYPIDLIYGSETKIKCIILFGPQANSIDKKRNEMLVRHKLFFN